MAQCFDLQGLTSQWLYQQDDTARDAESLTDQMIASDGALAIVLLG